MNHGMRFRRKVRHLDDSFSRICIDEVSQLPTGYPERQAHIRFVAHWGIPMRVSLRFPVPVEWIGVFFRVFGCSNLHRLSPLPSLAPSLALGAAWRTQKL